MTSDGARARADAGAPGREDAPAAARADVPVAAREAAPTAETRSAAATPPAATACVRRADVRRTTRETDVRVVLDLDGSGSADVVTGVGFYDHLLSSLAHHALFDLEVRARGDLDVDEHHTVEDVALSLGRALREALGDAAGIARFGDASVPMDEALATAVVDCSGRAYTVLALGFHGERIGSLSTQLVPHALESFAREAGITLHLRADGANDHHVAEASFKALARALRQAVAPDPRRAGVASTKGSLAG